VAALVIFIVLSQEKLVLRPLLFLKILVRFLGLFNYLSQEKLSLWPLLSLWVF
jgi:hypothetical protein